MTKTEVTNTQNLRLITENDVTVLIEEERATGVVSYDTPEDLPLIGNDSGDMAYVGNTNRLYLFNGEGWYNIALVDSDPSISGINSSYNLDSAGSQTIISVVGTDPEQLPISFGFSTNAAFDNIATVTQDDNFFGISAKAANISSRTGGSGTVTFTASDGVNITTFDSVFTLKYLTSISRSATSVNEGSNVTFTFNTSGYSNGETVPYTITGVSSADISGASLTGNVSITNNTGTLILTIASDLTTEGAETLTVYSGTISQTVTVNDTSLTPPVAASWSSSPTETIISAPTGLGYTPGRFGYSVGIDAAGDTIISGAQQTSSYQGSAHVFYRSGSSWINSANLLASDAAASSYFGAGCSISGNGQWIAVGSYLNSTNHPYGAVYIFQRSGNNFTQVQKITPSSGSYFGSYTDLNYDGTYLVSNNTGNGNVEIYTRSGSTFSFSATATPTSSLGGGGQIGYGVGFNKTTSSATTPNYLGVGAYAYKNTNDPNGYRGAGYIFVRSGSSWTQQNETIGQTLWDGLSWTNVTINENGDKAYWGAIGYGLSNSLFGGSGRMYALNRSGSTWSTVANFAGASTALGDNFGGSHDCDLSGDVLLVGAYGNSSYAGKAHAFSRSGNSFTEDGVWTASNITSSDLFGGSSGLVMSHDGSRALIAAYGRNQIYVYEA